MLIIAQFLHTRLNKSEGICGRVLHIRILKFLPSFEAVCIGIMARNFRLSVIFLISTTFVLCVAGHGGLTLRAI